MDSKKAVDSDKRFWHINNNLVNIGSTYVSLLIFNSNNDIICSKSSNSDWADLHAFILNNPLLHFSELLLDK